MTADYLNWLPLLPMLYAETHFTFAGFSLIYRPWPEVICDIPHRLEPDFKLPMLILVKDADKYPIILEKATVCLKSENDDPINQILIDAPIAINHPFWHQMFILDAELNPGHWQVDFELVIRKKGQAKPYQFHQDNHPGLSHRPFDLYVSRVPLPHFDGWISGDLHTHTCYTSDQVEFGAPLNTVAQMGQCMGLSFCGLTDHAYDLDNLESNYLQTDPDLKKWKTLWTEAENIEKQTSFVLIPGEEISVGNSQGKNCHLLMLNNRQFFSGKGDSAEIWFKTKPTHLIEDVLSQAGKNALVFAAHPEKRVPLLQHLLLGRGFWRDKDYKHSRLNGLQILNGSLEKAFFAGLERWKRLLLQGRRLTVIAGNDAHGNFNRYRQIALPGLWLEESEDHRFGVARTMVNIEDKIDRETVIDALQHGSSVITTGPALDMTIRTEKNIQIGLGSTLNTRHAAIEVRGKTIPEFGSFTILRCFSGDYATRKETCCYELTEFGKTYQFDITLKTVRLPEQGYLRSELWTLKGNQPFCAISNPIWIDIK